jgi:serine/threonine protein kinase
MLGPYRLLQRIAVGGMGEVWTAEAVDRPGERFAVKTLRSVGENAGPNTLSKFMDEARISVAVSNHPNIVRTLDVGLEGKHLYLVMELLEGHTLAQHFKRGVVFAPELVVGLALPVLAALEHAQNSPGPSGQPLKLVHRDLKPSNLFLTGDGVMKVIDFGIALATGVDATNTRSGVIRGTLAYLSPEQARAERPDARSDLYSFAVVLHELLSGKRLFDQELDAARLTAILFGDVPSIRSLRPEVPAALDEVVLWALKRDAADRPASAAQLAEALRKSILPAEPWGPERITHWLRDEAVTADPSFHLPEPSPSAPVSSISLPGLAAPPRSIFKAVLLVSALGAIGGTLLAIRSTAKPAPILPPPPQVVRVPPAIPEPTPVALAPIPEPAPVPEVAPEPPVKAAFKVPPRPKAVAAKALVHVTIDSRPDWATVSVDGKELGPTPLVRVPLSVGVHALTAVSSNGKRKSSKLRLVEGRDEKVLLDWAAP